MQGMVVASLLAVLLAADSPGPIAVVATSKRPGTEGLGTKVATRVLELLKREGVPDLLDDAKTVALLKEADFPDPRACNGGQKCAEKLALLLGPRAVLVSVDVGRIGKQLSIRIEAVSAVGPPSLSTADLMAPVDGWKEKSAVDITTFARGLKERLAAAPKPTPPLVDAPRPATLEPPPPPPTDLAAPAVVAAPRTAAWSTAAAGLAAAVTAAVFLGLGLADQARFTSLTFDDDISMQQGIRLMSAERDQLAASGNLKFTLTLTSGLVALALGGVSAWLFTKD